MSTGIDPVDSAPLIIRTYNDDSADNTFLLTRYDYPVSSNFVLRTSANGSLVPSDALTQTTMGLSSMTISNHFGSTIVYDTFSSATLFLPSGVFDTIVKTTMTASSVTASTIFINVLNICTINASTFSPNGITVAYATLGSTVQTSSILFSTLSADSLFTTTGFISTLYGSSIYGTYGSTTITTADTSRLSTLTTASTTTGSLFFSTLQGNTVAVSSLSGSSIYTNPLTTSMFNGNLLTMSTMNYIYTIFASSLYMNRMVFSTTTGSSIIVSTATAPFLLSNSLVFSSAQGSTTIASNITASSLYAPLLIGSTIQSNSFVFSTLIGSSLYTSNLTYSTIQGSTMLVSTTGISTLSVNRFFYSTLSGNSLAANTVSLASTLTGSTISWNTVVLSTLQGNTANVFFATTSTITANMMTASSIQGSTVIASSIIGSTINTNLFIGSTISSDSIVFSTISISTLSHGSTVFSTLQGSTSILSTMTVSSLSASSIVTSTLAGSTLFNNVLTVSSIQSDRIVFSTLNGSTLLLSTLTSCTINVPIMSISTLQGSTVSASTLFGSTLVSGQMVYSTLSGSTIMANTINVTSTCTAAGSFFLSTFSVTTQQVSSAFFSTLTVASTLTVSTLNRINPTTSTMSTLILSGGLQTNTATGLLVCSSLTVNAMNLTRSIVNQPVYGNTIKTNSITTPGVILKTSGIRATIDNLPNQQQTYTFGSAISNRWVAATNTSSILSYSNDGFNWVGTGASTLGAGRIAIWNGSIWVAVGDAASITPAKSGITTNTWTQNGVSWTASASSSLSGWPTYFAFDTLVGSDTTAWAAATNNYNSSGTYTGSITTTVNGIPSGVSFPSPSSGTSVAGEWLQLQSSTPLSILSYTWGCANNVNQVKSYCLVGSNDGSTWYFIQYVTYPTSPCTTSYASISTPLTAYYTGTQTVTGNVTVSATTVSTPYVNNSTYTYFRMIGIQLFSGAGNMYFETGEWAISFSRGTIAYSYDGIKWTSLGASIFTNFGLEVAWNGVMWVAVGGGTNSIAYSYDGINWTGLGTGVLSGYGHAIVWNGQMWVATGIGSDTLAYSYNGIHWTGLGTGIFTTGSYGIGWNGRMWIAVGDGTNTIAYSYDGINWVGLGTSIITAGAGVGVAWNGVMWVALGAGTNTIAYSYDGINWTVEGSQGTIAARYVRFEYGDALTSRYLQIAEVRVYTATGTNIITPSTTVTSSYVNASYPASNVVDGNITTFYHSDLSTSPWLQIDLGSLQNIYKVEFVNRPDCCRGRIAGARMVLKAADGTTVLYTSNLMTLKDNITTAYQDSPGNEGYLYYSWWPGLNTTSYGSDSSPFMFETSVFSNGRKLAWNGAMWLAGGSGINSLAYSYNGINWTGLGNVLGSNTIGMGTYFNSSRPHRITFPAPMTVATGSGTNTLAYSPDGINWTGTGLGIFTTSGTGVATNGSTWVATGSGTNTLAYSTTDMETPYIYLPFENGLLVDVMGNSTITVTGSPTFVTGVAGSTAISLANTAGSTATQYLQGGCTLGNNFTVSLWFKLNTLPATDATQSAILSLGSSTAMSFHLIYLTLAGGYTGFYVQYYNSSNIAASIVGKISISTGTWYQCTVIFQGSGVCSVYLNNTFIGSNAGNGLYTPITTLRIGYNFTTIGGQAATNTAMNGVVDDVRIYNYAITPYSRVVWRGLGTSVFSTQGNGVAWNGSMWVAVGSGTNSIAYSYDGITWIGLGTSVFTTSGNGVAWNGSMWIVVGSGTNSMAYSYDGITWTISSIYNTQWNGVAWNGLMWIVVGSGPNIMACSYDGINWNIISSTTFSYVPFDNSPLDVYGKLTSPTIVGTITYSNSIRVNGNYSAYFANTAGNSIADNYLDYLTPLSLQNPTAFTISFWMYPTAYSIYTAVIPIGFNDGNGTRGLYFHATSLGINAAFATTTATTSTNVYYSNSNTLFKWWHVVFTFSIVSGSGVGTLYMNGIAQSSTTVSGTGGLSLQDAAGPMTHLTIGCQGAVTGAYAYTGYIDDVRIYTSALTPSVILLLYNTPPTLSYIGNNPTLFTTSGNGVAWNGVRWVAVGSGTNTILYSTNGITWTAAASSCFTTAGNGVTWNGSRWVATGTGGTTGIGYSSDGSTWTGGNVQNRTNTLSPQLTSLAAYNWIQNGIAWKASASTEYLSANYAYSAFNNNSSNTGATWGSALIYNTTTGAYNGSVSTTIQGIGATTGEWLQLQSSNPLVLQSYTYACWGIATLPKEYYIVGSNDGSTWYPLQYVLMSVNPCTATYTACTTYLQMNYTGIQNIKGNVTGTGSTTAYPYTTSTYTYFRIIVRSLWPSSTGVAELGELYFNFGSPFVSNPFDASRYFYHYTLNAGATVGPSSQKLNTPSITLASASSQYLSTSSFTSTVSGLTFAFWYKSNSSGSWARIFDFGNGAPSDNILCSINGSNLNYLHFEVYYGTTSSNTALTDINYNDNTWRHVVWTLTNAATGSATSTWNIYINSTLKTTVTSKYYPTTTVTRSTCYIGRSNWVADGYYNGNIDDFRIYNAVLTAAQISTIYSASVVDSTYNTTFSTAGTSVAANPLLTGTVNIQHPVVAVGQGTHTLAYSPDGVQWTGLGTSLFSTAGYGAAWNGTQWIAAGQGTNTLAYSPDGLRWVGLGTVIFSTQANGVAWNGTQWVAVGSGTNSVAYSSDGFTWTGSVSGNAIFTTSANSVAWNGTQWIVVGQGTNSIAYSFDGITWTAIGSTVFSTKGNAVSWTGSLWIAVGSGTNTIAYSSNGTTWTGLGVTVFSTSGNGVTWNGTRWVAVGSGTNTIAYSANGTTWTGFGTNLFSTAGNGITWTGTRFVAVGSGTNTILYSQDGITWYSASATLFTQGNGIAGNPRIGATICDSQVVLNNTSSSNTLDIVSDTYYNTGYSNFSAMIETQSYIIRNVTATINKTIPGAPTNISAVLYPAGNPTGVNVSFTAPTNLGGGVELYYASAIDILNIQTTIIASSATSPIYLTGLVPDTTYQIGVYSYNIAGNSATTLFSSNLLYQTIPGAPTSVTAALTPVGNPTGVLISFTPPSNLGGGVLTYTATAYSGATPISTASGSSSPLTITGLTAGTSYTYSVVLRNTVGTSATSNVATLVYKTQPGAPTAVSGVLYPSGNPTGINVSFTSPTNLGGGVDLYYASAIDTLGIQTTVTVSSATSPVYLSGLVAGTTYRIQVYSSNAGGQSTPTVSASTLLYQVLPSAPQNVSVALDSVTNPAGIVVSFTAPTMGGGIPNYTVTTYQGSTFVSSQTGTSLSPIVTGLTGGLLYSFSVVATNTAGTGPVSNTASLTYYTKPAPATNVTVALYPAATPTGVNVSFTPSANTGGSTLTYVATAYSGATAIASSTASSSSPLYITGLTAGQSYTYSIVATNVNVTTIVSDASVATVATTYYTQPVAPTSVTATLNSTTAPTGVNVSFTPPANTLANTGGAALTYIATAYSGVTAIASSTSSSASTLSITGLTEGTSYTYKVVSSNGALSSNPSVASAALTYYTKPDPATNVTVALYPAATPTGVNVSFTPPANTGGSALTYVATAYSGATAIASSTASSSSPLYVTGLTAGQSYTYSIVATNVNVITIVSDVSVASAVTAYYTQPVAPTSVIAALNSTTAPTAVIVSFTAPTNTLANTGGAALTYVATAYSGVTAIASSTSSSASPLTVTGLTAGTSYTYKVVSSNGFLSSNPSVASAALTYYTKPDPATLGTVTSYPAAAPTGVNVSFTPPANTGGSALTYVATAYSGITVIASSTASGSSPLYVTGLTAGQSYTYSIVATNVNVTTIVSDASALSAATAYYTQPAAPTGVTATLNSATAPTGVNVSFTPPANTLANTGGAALTYVATAYSGTTPIASSTSGSASPLAVSGLTAGTSYTYKVVSSNGFLSNTSVASAALTYYTKPSPATNITVALNPISAPTGVNVSFTASTDTGGGTLSYTATAYSGVTPIAFITGATSPLKITGLTAGITYTYSIIATNGGVTSDVSNTATLMYQTNPSVPQSVTAVVSLNTTSVSWSAPSSNGGTALVSYQVVSSPAGYNSGVLSISTTSVTATGLTNGTSYTFTITVTNSSGLTNSTTSSAVTPYTLPGTPTGLTRVAASQQITLSWTAPSNGGKAITGYRIINITTSTTFLLNTPSTSYIWTGLTNGTSYTFSVAATNDNINYGTSVTSVSIAPFKSAPQPKPALSLRAGAGGAAGFGGGGAGGVTLSGYNPSSFATAGQSGTMGGQLGWDGVHYFTSLSGGAAGIGFGAGGGGGGTDYFTYVDNYGYTSKADTQQMGGQGASGFAYFYLDYSISNQAGGEVFYTSNNTYTFAYNGIVNIVVMGGGGGGRSHFNNGGGGAAGYLRTYSVNILQGWSASISIGGGGESDNNGGTTIVTINGISYTAPGGGDYGNGSSGAGSDGIVNSDGSLIYGGAGSSAGNGGEGTAAFTAAINYATAHST